MKAIEWGRNAMIAAVGSLLVFGQTLAQVRVSASPNRPAPFGRADANHDGKVTLVEFTEVLPPAMKSASASLFKQFDLNGDGALSPEEYRQLAGGPARRAASGERPITPSGQSLQTAHCGPSERPLAVSAVNDCFAARAKNRI